MSRNITNRVGFLSCRLPYRDRIGLDHCGDPYKHPLWTLVLLGLHREAFHTPVPVTMLSAVETGLGCRPVLQATFHFHTSFPAVLPSAVPSELPPSVAKGPS